MLFISSLNTNLIMVVQLSIYSHLHIVVCLHNFVFNYCLLMCRYVQQKPHQKEQRYSVLMAVVSLILVSLTTSTTNPLKDLPSLDGCGKTRETAGEM